MTLFWRFLLRVIRALVPLFCRLRVTGTPPATGPLIIVSNHIGTFDPFTLMAAAAKAGRHPRFLATAGLFDAPIFGTIMRASGHIRVNRGSTTATGALTNAITAINDNACVIIYPEGRITLDPGLWPERPKTGAARLALATGAPVTVATQWGAHEIMTWDQPARMATTLLTSIIRRPTAHIHFAPPTTHLNPDSPTSARIVANDMTTRCLATLTTMRTNEPHTPRYIDHTRPLTTERTFTPNEAA